VLEHARDHHDHNASNHSPNGSPATGSRFADDDNDSHGRWLLITEPVAVTAVVDTALWAVFPFQKAALNSTGHKPVATVANDAQDS
jgi:hypothetical protein